ncbi:MAG: translocation/assembly module TamB domain-containing protein [Elusimicrobia bacterium]|nr:translocation/assembly module TamB domain-containing protein [Elusimicrobiota bacterium]
MILIVMLLPAYLSAEDKNSLPMEIIKRHLLRKYGLVAEYSDIKYSFPNTVTAGQVTIKDPAGIVLARFNEMVSDVQVKGIAVKNISFSRISMKDIYLYAEKDRSGKITIPFFSYLKSDKGLKTAAVEEVKFIVQRFIAEKAMISIKDANGTTDIAAERLKADTSGEQKPAVVNVKVSQISIPSGKQRKITEIGMTAVFENRKVIVKNIGFRLDDTAYFTGKAEYVHETKMASAEINVSVFGGNMKGALIYALNEKSLVSSKMDLQGISLAELKKNTGMVRGIADGIIGGTAEFSGKPGVVSTWKVDAVLNVEKAIYGNTGLPGLKFEAKINGGRLEASLTQGVSSVGLKGMLKSADEIDLIFNADFPEIEDMARIMGVSSLSGNIIGQGYIRGSVKDPYVSCDMSGSSVKYSGLAVRAGRLLFTYSDSEIYLDSLELSGQTDLAGITYKTSSGGHPKGMLSYSLSLSGPYKYPSGYFKIEVIDPALDSIRLEKIRIEGQVKNRTISIRKSHIEGYGARCGIKGELHYEDKTGNLKLLVRRSILAGQRGEKILSADISFISGEEMFEITVDDAELNVSGLDIVSDRFKDINGKAVIRGKFGMHNGAPVIETEIKTGKLRAEDLLVDDLYVKCLFREGILHLEEVILSRGSDRIDINAEFAVDIKSGKPVVLSGEIPSRLYVKGDVDLSSVGRLIASDFNMEGKVQADLRICGTMCEAESEGYLKIEDGHFSRTDAVSAIEDAEIDITIKDRTVTLKNACFSIAGHDVRMTGNTEYANMNEFNFTFKTFINGKESLTGEGRVSGERLDMEIRSSDTDLSIFKPFFGSLKELGGNAGGQLKISGTAGHPELSGNISIKGIVMADEDDIIDVGNGEIEIYFNDYYLTIGKVSAILNDGRMQITGRAGIKDKKVVDTEIRLHFEENRLDIPGVVRCRLKTADMDVAQADGRFLISGIIDAGEVKYTGNISIDDLIRNAKIVSVKRRHPGFDKIDLDIEIPANDQLYINNNLGKLRLSSELRIIGTISSPNLLGSVRIIEGSVYYLDRTFAIEKGEMTCSDLGRINPYFDISANTSVRSYRQETDMPYRVKLVLTGYPSSLQVSLTSDPPLSEPDIVSLITLGAPGSQLAGNTQGDTNESAAELISQRLGSLSSRRVSGYISANVGNMLSLDSIDIEGNIFKAGSEQGPAIRATKKMTRTIALSYINSLNGAPGAMEARRSTGSTEVIYETGIGHTNEQKITMGYKLSRYFMIQSHADQRGASGISLKYTLWKE